MMQTERRSWHKPALCVLVRNRPEEVLMSWCKGTATPGSPNDAAGGCMYSVPPCGGCDFATVS